MHGAATDVATVVNESFVQFLVWARVTSFTLAHVHTSIVQFYRSSLNMDLDRSQHGRAIVELVARLAVGCAANLALAAWVIHVAVVATACPDCTP